MKPRKTASCITCGTRVKFVRTEINARHVFHYYEPCPKCAFPDGMVVSHYRRKEDNDLMVEAIRALCSGDRDAARKVLKEHKRRVKEGSDER